MLNIAFIGSGSIAGTHAGAIDKDLIRIAAAVDTNADAAEKFASAHGAEAFGSVDDFIARADGGLEIDAVVLCTPPSARHDILAGVVERGIHALIEKPLAATTDEAERVVALRDAHPGVVLAVGFCHRFAPAVVKMRDMVAAGDIGRLIRFENTFAFHHPPLAERWFSDPAVSGGGALVDAGCHSIDLFHFLVGPSEPAGAVLDRPWAGRGESGATALLRCGSGDHAGAAGVVVSGWMEPERFDLRLIGEGGALSYDYMKPEELVHAPTGGEAATLSVEPHDLRFARQLQHFARACAEPNDASRRAPMAGVEEGLSASRTISGLLADG